MHECNFCPQRFLTARALIIHLLIDHQGEMRAEVKNLETETMNNLAQRAYICPDPRD